MILKKTTTFPCMKVEEPHPEHKVPKADFHIALTYYKTTNAQKSAGMKLRSEDRERDGNQLGRFSPCLATL